MLGQRSVGIQLITIVPADGLAPQGTKAPAGIIWLYCCLSASSYYLTNKRMRKREDTENLRSATFYHFTYFGRIISTDY